MGAEFYVFRESYPTILRLSGMGVGGKGWGKRNIIQILRGLSRFEWVNLDVTSN